MVVAGGLLILSVALGARQTFGLFMSPIAASHAASLPLIAFALAIQNLIWGIVQPLVGSLSDRYGPAPVVACGAIVYASGLALVAMHPNAVTIVLGLGVLVGVALSATTFSVVVSAVSRAASDKQRATAVALAAAGGSLGQVALVPIAQSVMAHASYERALIVLALLALALIPAGWALGASRLPNSGPGLSQAGTSWAAMRTALLDRNYLFLTAGFFACGLQLAFIAIHLPTYLSICHLAPNIGVTSLALIGFFNIIGSYGFGKAMDFFPPQRLLAILYTIRSTAILAFIAVPPTAITTLTFASVMGLAWLGTVPLTNGVIARLYGVKNLGALFGVCFLSHQAGSFLGAWLGGLSLQLTGSYETMWVVLIVVGYGGALLNIPIRIKEPAVATA
jgi:predicted MFS family arabinose efflux permease